MSVEAAIASYELRKVPFVSVLEALYALLQRPLRLVRVLAGHASTRAAWKRRASDPGATSPLLRRSGMATTVQARAGSDVGRMGNR